MNLISIPAFQDNYIWVLIENHGRCIIVDPGESAPVSGGNRENQWQPEGHFTDPSPSTITSAGVKQLRENFPHLVVYDG